MREDGRKQEGFYCKSCGAYHGETGTVDSLCKCAGQLEYYELPSSRLINHNED